MSKVVPGKSTKRPGSAISGASGSGAKKRSRKPVEIPEDVWLDALKFLSCPKWSKTCLVSRQLNGVAQRNVSRLPLAIIDSAAMTLREREKTEVVMIVSDFIIVPDEQDEWFKDRGLTLGVPGDIQLINAIIGLDFEEDSCVDLCILGPAQKKKLTPSEKKLPWFFGQQFSSEVLFYAEFSPHRNKYSWASMAFFLKLLYDQSTYVKNLSMYGFDKKLKEILFADEEKRYIRCGSFALQVSTDDSVEDLRESLSWLEQNVKYDNILFPSGIPYKESEGCDAVTDYLLGSSWTSASQEVKLGEINGSYYLELFFGILIKKFPTAAVQSIFPTVVFSGWQPLRCDSLNKGKSIVKVKLEGLEDDSDNYQNDSVDIKKAKIWPICVLGVESTEKERYEARDLARIGRPNMQFVGQFKERNKIEPKILVADSVISPNTPWFKDSGMALAVPANIQLSKAVIAVDLKDNFCLDLCVLGPAQEQPLNKYEKGRPWFSGNKWLPGHQFQTKVLFYAEFSPLRSRYSAASLAFFLKLLYDPSTFVKREAMVKRKELTGERIKFNSDASTLRMVVSGYPCYQLVYSGPL
ncbi:hypothetical protein DdX_14656 [Ditylenchus destructor]|uniref:F-box domain-containing protein n=1 Tax=Ditylenchus destructor TaxID=166010 RepID=A0AAD4QYE8_9BILA|nr:hypothetical protein DdX_14656 [Ditylenchus destructor]